MSEAIFVEDGPSIRSRRACSNCYEKKIKCDYNPDFQTCTLCQKNKLKCEIPLTDAAKPRKSIRTTVEELESRVLSLEGNQSPMNSIARTPQTNVMSFAPDAPQLPPDSRGEAGGMSTLPDTRSIPLTRGATSPWSVLVSGTDGSNPALDSFHASTVANADSASSLKMPNSSTSNKIVSEIPGLTSSKIYEYARNYACVAPYPILHWDSLKTIIQALNEGRPAVLVGQTTCVWIYMAFGAAHILEKSSGTTTDAEPGAYFDKAWKLLPQLLLDYDLWALKAVTLMVHYLQASAKPQACWALLGTALRLAVSLGFDRADSNLGIYSDIEQEEGRRAFWLCHLMEKSLCINLGHASPFTVSPNLRKPRPFTPISGDVESDIFGENEQDAATFFGEMIALTEVRDKIFAALRSSEAMSTSSHQQLLSRTQTISRSGTLTSSPATVIRDSVHNLAHYNTLQVLDTSQRQISGRPVSKETVLSARKSLDLISESQKSDQLMCLWMWLYYAFTSAVVLFLHSVANILDHDTALNLAAISDFEDICTRLKDVSEGAAQCMEVAKAMRITLNKLVKVAGRKRNRESGDLTEGDARKKKSQPDVAAATDPQPDPSVWQQSTAANPNAMLAEAPANFAWDEWDKWLEDVNLAGGDGF